MQDAIRNAADAAFDRYAHAVAVNAIPASQLDLFDSNSRALAIEWRGIWLACERAVTP